MWHFRLYDRTYRGNNNWELKMTKAGIAGAPQSNNDCKMHKEYHFTCGTCNGYFDKDGHPTNKAGELDELDEILDDIPGDWQIYFEAKEDAKAALTKYIELEVRKARIDELKWVLDSPHLSEYSETLDRDVILVVVSKEEINKRLFQLQEDEQKSK